MKNITRNFEDIDVQFLSKIEMENYEQKRKIREGFMVNVNRRRDNWKAMAEQRNLIKVQKPKNVVEAEYYREEIIRSNEEIMKSEI